MNKVCRINALLQFYTLQLLSLCSCGHKAFHWPQLNEFPLFKNNTDGLWGMVLIVHVCKEETPQGLLCPYYSKMN